MARRQRLSLVFVGWLTASGILVRLAWWPGLRLSGLAGALLHEPPTRTIPLLLALTFAVLVGWVAITVALTVLAETPGAVGRAAVNVMHRVSPRFLRRAVEVALGATTVLTSLSGAAQAATGSAPARPVGTAQQLMDRPTAVRPDAGLPLDALAVSLDRPTEAPPLPVLDRPVDDPSRGLALVAPVGTRSHGHHAHQAHAVRVKVGDSLWQIAARSLPPGAGDDQIEQAWHRWYAANRAVIGNDPDVLLPGQLLTPPQA